MGRRTIIGLFYFPNTNWIAGTYYIQNIVQSLNLCEDKLKPIIKVFTYDYADFVELQENTKYPYLRYRPMIFEPKYQNIIRRILKKIFKCKILSPEKIPYLFEKMDIIYPVVEFSVFRNYDKIVGWIPDFQEKYMPEMFSTEEILGRESICRTYAKHHAPIIFSSEAARDDYKKFHPDLCDTSTFVLRFAVFHPMILNKSIEELKEKFGIVKEYLFCANQFWMHKNHKFLFKAFKEARNHGLELQLVCSGKLYDYRNPEYASEIKSFIEENNLEKDVLLLGFINREEQLTLMKNSYAIIQPSLFEGWSTVVEDAKCLNKFIFLSDLPVHREQNPVDVCYFDPYDENDLILKMLNVKPTTHEYDYTHSQRNFGEEFIKIVNMIKQKRVSK